MFECSADDSCSTIYRSGLGVDITNPQLNLREAFIDESRLKVIKVLRKGDEPYTMNVKTDTSPQERKIRFTHK